MNIIDKIGSFKWAYNAGIKYGYPRCCILFYCYHSCIKEDVRDINFLRLRQERKVHVQFVQCEKHRREFEDICKRKNYRQLLSKRYKKGG